MSLGWNYRIMKSKGKQGHTFFGIHEVYYNDKGEIDGYTAKPILGGFETLQELRDTLELMMRDLAKDRPILDYDEEDEKAKKRESQRRLP